MGVSALLGHNPLRLRLGIMAKLTGNPSLCPVAFTGSMKAHPFSRYTPKQAPMI
jgi:hypothetical protein